MLRSACPAASAKPSIYAAKRCSCGPGAVSLPTKQFYTKLLVYNTVVLEIPEESKTWRQAKEILRSRPASIVQMTYATRPESLDQILIHKPLSDSAIQSVIKSSLIGAVAFICKNWVQKVSSGFAARLQCRREM